MTQNSKLMMMFAIAALAFAPHRAHAEEYDLGVETEARFADSEGAIAEAEDTRRRALEEREQAHQAKLIAIRESERARKAEAVAKAKIEKWTVEEKAQAEIRKAAQARTDVAMEKLRQTQSALDAKEAELKAINEVVEQTVGERDRAELMLEQAQEKIARIELRIKEQKRQKQLADAGLIAAREKLKVTRDRLRELSRSPSSNASSGGTAPSSAASNSKVPPTIK